MFVISWINIDKYCRTDFREALRTGFYDLQSHRDGYRTSVGPEGMNLELIMKFIEMQCIMLAPITPHVSEWMWKAIGKVFISILFY